MQRCVNQSQVRSPKNPHLSCGPSGLCLGIGVGVLSYAYVVAMSAVPKKASKSGRTVYGPQAASNASEAQNPLGRDMLPRQHIVSPFWTVHRN